MTSATSLASLSGAPGTPFATQIWSLYDQAQTVMSESLGFLVPPGPYTVQATLPAGLTLPPGGQVTVGPPVAGSPAGESTFTCSGPMLDTTRTALLQLSSDAGFAAAINQLYTQAWDPPAPALSVTQQLIDNIALSTAADRYDFVLTGLLAYLINTQSRDLVKQTLSQALSMDPSVVALLIDGNADLGWPSGILASSFDPTRPAIADFLGGLVGSYYATASVPTPPGSANLTLVRIDAGTLIDAVGLPATGSVLWQGKLLVPTTGSYSFATTVDASESVTLTLDGQPVTLATPGAPISTIALTAGQMVDLTLELDSASATSTVTLQWGVAPTPLSALASVPALAFMPCDTTEAYPSLNLLNRIAVLIDGFSMSAAEVAWFSTYAADFAGTDPSNGATAPFSLPALANVTDSPALFNQWQRLNSFYSLKATLPATNTTLLDVFAAAVATDPLPEVVETIASATGWDTTVLEALAGSIDASSTISSNAFDFTVPQFVSEGPLVKLSRCISLCLKAGIPATQLFTWANLSVTSASSSPYTQAAQDIQNSVKAKYDSATWLEVGKPLNDSVRSASKAALIDYILYLMPNSSYSTADDLYGYFLIDVAMCTCMETSRIVQASAAVQLFVQRCLLNLESEVPPSTLTATDVMEWEQWRKNYRVWQAATEVFLYPENWIDPTLRPNKTPFFEDLETALLQGDVNEANVEAAFLTYLQSLQQVARLDIVGIYTDDDTEANTQITHIIGRTFTTPYTYFYRWLDNTTFAWSPWEQITAEISGDSLVPVVWNRRLFLFWPVYNEVSDPSSNSSSNSSVSSQSGSNGASSTSIPPASSGSKTLQIQMAYSEYKSGSWTSKQVTPDYLVPAIYNSYSIPLDQTCFFYNTPPQIDDTLLLVAYGTNDNIVPQLTLLAELAVVALAKLAIASNNDNGSSAWNNAVQAMLAVNTALPLLQPFLSAADYSNLYNAFTSFSGQFTSNTGNISVSDLNTLTDL